MPTPSELNILLIPTFLQGMTNAQICAFIKSCTSKAKLFRHQVFNFYYKLSQAKKYTTARKCYCPTKVEWTTSRSCLIIDQTSMCNYFDFYACSNTGFAFIMRKVSEFTERQKLARQYLQDGKVYCQPTC